MPSDPIEYCQRCHRIIMQPGVNYGINPDAICGCPVNDPHKVTAPHILPKSTAKIEDVVKAFAATPVVLNASPSEVTKVCWAVVFSNEVDSLWATRELAQEQSDRLNRPGLVGCGCDWGIVEMEINTKPRQS